MKLTWIFFQALSVPFTTLLLKVLRVKVVYENSVPFEKSCLVISNHESKLDPFFILTSYSLESIVRGIPFRFPVDEEYMKKKFLGRVISFFGGFSVGSTMGERAKSLFYIRNILGKNGSVLIFPEARLVDTNHRFEDFQKGYTYLVTGKTQIILVRLEHFHNYQKKIFDKKRPVITFRTIPSSTKKEDALKIIKEFYLSW
jgi:1-acyl-sn-glycerol-3-phosphate acyltransferase